MTDAIQISTRHAELNKGSQRDDSDKSCKRSLTVNGPDLQIIYITTGCGILESDDVYLDVQAGSLVLFFSNQNFRFKAINNAGWTALNLQCHIDLVNYLLDNHLLKPYPRIIQCGTHEIIKYQFSKVIFISQNKESNKDNHLRSEVIELINKSLELSDAELFAKTSRDKHVEFICHYIEENYHQKIDFINLASQCSISYSYFGKIFKKYKGISPAQYLVQVRIRKAKSLLLNTRLSVVEVARLTGFESNFYFSRIFKQKTGYAPTELRNNHI
ncbi:MAG: helix-turn-helix transcriptional regulator [Marinilabiliaceae bacterium]|nr:helix-turn-helix transcriptional regulator [Marinilabiliaceae bacterium]